MENKTKQPNVVLTINRDANGYITEIAYTVNQVDTDEKRIIEFVEIISTMYSGQSEILQPSEKEVEGLGL